jgi:hypothetical protein
VTGGAPAPARRVLVAGAGAGNLKSAVALNLAAALAAAGVAARLRDLDGASSRALAGPGVALGGGGRVRLPWAAADLAVAAPGVAGGSDADAAVEVVDPPPRFDAAVRALAASALLVLVPVDATALALRVLGEVAPAVAAGGGRLRVVLARRLPRAADRWALVDQLDALAPDALSPVTLPMARPGAARAAALYAPGTRGAAAYARLAAEVCALLGVGPGHGAPRDGISTSA